MGYPIHHYDTKTRNEFSDRVIEVANALEIKAILDPVREHRRKWGNMSYHEAGSLFWSSEVGRKFARTKGVENYFGALFGALPSGADLVEGVKKLGDIQGVYVPALGQIMYRVGYETNVPAAIQFTEDLDQQSVRDFGIKYGNLEDTQQLFEDFITLVSFSGDKEVAFKAANLSERSNLHSLGKVFRTMVKSYKYPEAGRFKELLEHVGGGKFHMRDFPYLCDELFSRKVA